MKVDLVVRARGRDRDAFARLAAMEVGRMLAVARLIVRDDGLAEDAVQEALVRCWRQLPQLRDADRFDAWLYRILAHAASDEAKRQRRFRAAIRTVRLEPSVDAVVVVAERDELERGFRHLSVEHRTVVVLHHYLGLPLTEIAVTLGIPTGTVKSRYHYAMDALRAALEAESRPTARAEALT